MTFRITARLTPLVPAKPPSPAIVAAREKVCRACDYFGAGARCYRPCDLCGASELRRRPWKGMPRCPDNRWA